MGPSLKLRLRTLRHSICQRPTDLAMSQPMSLDVSLSERIFGSRPPNAPRGGGRGGGGPARGNGNDNGSRRGSNRVAPYVSLFSLFLSEERTQTC